MKYKDIIKTKPRFNGVLSRNNLPKIIDGTYKINLDENKSTGTHWIALYENGNNKIYFDGFGVGYIPKEVQKFKGKKNIAINIYRIFTDFGFIDFMMKGKSLLDHTNLFSPNKYEKNGKIVLEYFP